MGALESGNHSLFNRILVSLRLRNILNLEWFILSNNVAFLIYVHFIVSHYYVLSSSNRLSPLILEIWAHRLDLLKASNSDLNIKWIPSLKSLVRFNIESPSRGMVHSLVRYHTRSSVHFYSL